MEWDERRLIDILEICDSGTWGEGEANPKTGYPVLRSNNIQDWKLDLSVDVAYRKVTQRDVDRYRLANGDIIVTRSSGSAHLIGKCALFDLEPADGIFLFSNFTQRLRPNRAAILPRYLFFYLRSPQARDAIDRMHTTTSGLRNLRIREYRLQPIPLPPLDEQRRIVACIEELTERIDAARRLRAEAAEEVAAILPSALAEVFEEAEERGEQITKLGQVIREMRNGIYKPKQFYGDGYPSLRMYNIQDRQIVMEDVKYLKVTEDELETYGLKPGDILVNRVNSKELVGKAALVPDGLGPCTFESKNIRVRVDETQVTPAYVVYFLGSVVCKQQIAQRLKPAIGQATINQGDIQSLEMPLPSLDEQRRIVEHLDAVQAKVEAIRRYQQETQQEIEAMTGAVLERAFRGEL